MDIDEPASMYVVVDFICMKNLYELLHNLSFENVQQQRQQKQQLQNLHFNLKFSRFVESNSYA